MNTFKEALETTAYTMALLIYIGIVIAVPIVAAYFIGPWHVLWALPVTILLINLLVAQGGSNA